MLQPFEKRKLFNYLNHYCHNNRKPSKKLLEFVQEYKDMIGFDIDYTHHMSEVQIKQNLVAVKKFISTQSQKPLHYKPSKLENNITIFADLFALTEDEKEIFGLLVHYDNYRHIKSMIEDIVDSRYPFKNHIYEIFYGFLNISQHKLSKILVPTNALFSKGLILYDCSGELKINDNLKFFINAKLKNKDDLKTLYLQKYALKSQLTIDDFGYVAKDIEYICNLIKAEKPPQKGVNILLYGAPGTGKTQLATSLAHHLNGEVYNVGIDENGDEPSREARIAHLNLSQSFLRIFNQRDKDQQYCLLFDEAEDFFDRGGSIFRPKAGSKIYMNNLLENNPVPVFWCTNDIEQIDHAFLRRFSYVLEMKNPPLQYQKKIWYAALKKHKLTLSEQNVGDLIKTYKSSPAMVAQVTRVASMNKGDMGFFQDYLNNVYKAMYGKMPRPINQHQAVFNLALTQTDTNLECLTQQLIAHDNKNFSLCLYGASGTGKSAYGKYLADALQMEVLYKRASDIQDCYVGGTEKNIARAFTEAKDEDALLMLDEADSFLRDRRMAQRSWEVSAVNEMLVQMESHHLPFICTTNLFDDIDQASLRRFTFKIKYDYLTVPQTALAFQHFFNMKLSDADAKNIRCAAPGDFANLYHKAKILGVLDDYQAILAMLAQELQNKNISNPIGFNR